MIIGSLKKHFIVLLYYVCTNLKMFICFFHLKRGLFSIIFKFVMLSNVNESVELNLKVAEFIEKIKIYKK